MLPPIVVRLAIAGLIALLISRFTVKEKSIRQVVSSVSINGVWAYIVGVKLSLLITHFSSIKSEPLLFLYGWGGTLNTVIGILSVLGYFAWFLWKKSQNRKHHTVFLLTASTLFVTIFLLSPLVLPQDNLNQTLVKTNTFSQLKDLDGAPMDFNPEQITILNFWATWCPPCRAEMPELDAFAIAHPEVNFISINNISSESGGSGAVEEFLQEKGYQFPTTLDYQDLLKKKFEVNSFPTTIVLAPSGKVLDHHVGVISQSQLEGYLSK